MVGDSLKEVGVVLVGEEVQRLTIPLLEELALPVAQNMAMEVVMQQGEDRQFLEWK
jgi:hypothetical protein